MIDVPNMFYRVSVKALILDGEKRFLLFCEDNGLWELPGGGLNFGENPRDCLIREIREEANLEVESISPNPSYFFISRTRVGNWKANIVYVVKVKNLDFKPSDECQEIRFFSNDTIPEGDGFRYAREFAKEYNSTLH